MPHTKHEAFFLRQTLSGALAAGFEEYHSRGN